MTPRTIAVGKKEQNGDVEALNGCFEATIEATPFVTGKFPDFSYYLRNIKHGFAGYLKKANRLREKKLAEELAVMRPLDVKRFPRI